ncbi:MAG TPA: chitobiase/beta-hexosaminidase C-terminal domain-containing protein [Candidatus Acidoferrales bacterium]|nr:chitobiase/beta-hexosaminidase C-terminal domain-containing protein [Candidatus Acidoferrales bacterium]
MSDTIQYQDLWPLLQADINNLLQADDLIGSRPGIIVEPGDIQSVIDAKLARVIGAGTDGKLGVGYLTLPIERATDENPNIPGSPLKLTLTIDFVENVIINQSANGTKIPIRIYAARAAKILKLYTPVGFTQSLVPATPVISEFTDDKSKSLRVGRVEFTAYEADDAPMRRLDRPQIGVTGDVTQLSNLRCQINSGQPLATVTQPAATNIFYTLDGSHPFERNPAATLYTGPVTITGPCLFRCRAFGTGDQQLASDTAAKNFV